MQMIVFLAYSVSITRTVRLILAVAVRFVGYKSGSLKYLEHVFYPWSKLSNQSDSGNIKKHLFHVTS